MPKINKAKFISITNYFDINNSEILKLIDKEKVLSGSISNIYIYENIIKVKEYKFLLSNKLMKRISINSIYKFINFDKKLSERYKYNKFSNIFLEDKNILNIKFLDYDENNKNNYDTIEVDSIEHKIQGKIIEITINHLYQNNCFIKKNI